MVGKWTDALLSKLQVLLGERGAKADQAVRFRDVDQIQRATINSTVQIVNTIVNPGLAARLDAAEAAIVVTDTAVAGLNSDIAALVLDVAQNDTDITALEGQVTLLQTDYAALDGTVSGHTTAISGLVAAVDDPGTGLVALAGQQTLLQASIQTVDETSQGFTKILLVPSDGITGAAVTASVGPPAVGQASTVLVQEGATARVTSGVPNGFTITVPASRAVLFGGNRIKIAVLAQAPTLGAATRFGIAYSTGTDSTGYVAAADALSTVPQWFTFYFDVPMLGAVAPHYLSIFGDDDKAGGGTIISRVWIEVAAVAGDVPQIGLLQATVNSILGVQADELTGTALAALFTQLDVDAGGTSATLTAQGAALATLEGYAAATYTLRVSAGGESAGFEIVAANDPTGPVSLVRISADNIIMDGTVTAEHMNVTSISAISANLGEFVSGDPTGERLVIRGDRIDIYDASNTLRVRIGDLS